MRRHLVKDHPIASANAKSTQGHEDQDTEFGEEEGERSSQTPEESVEQSPSPSSGHMSLVTRPNPEGFRKALLKWVVSSRVSFQNVTSQAFIDMILAANPALAPFLRTSGTTIARWVKDEYLKARERVKSDLQQARSKIHVSFDGWTSPNGKGLLAVVAHWLTPQLTLDCALLTIREIDGAHSGEHIAAVIHATVTEFDIGERLGTFIADNAPNNDRAVGKVLQHLGRSSNDKAIKERRSRCLGHIINLAAKAFIFGVKVDVFEAEDATYQHRRDEDALAAARALWRRKGAVGKFHNICVFIKASPQRQQIFARRAKELIDERMILGDQEEQLQDENAGKPPPHPRLGVETNQSAPHLS